MFLAMAEDARVVLIKLADRLHNMRTLAPLPEERRRKISQETIEIYAPLAHRLGIWEFKWELEDTAFQYLEPDRYEEISHLLAGQREERENYIDSSIEALQVELERLHIHAEVTGRPKHVYSIAKKLEHQGSVDFSRIFDLLAVRILVDEVKDCYGAIGVIHSLWKPIPGRFKDYVAMPKFNMYQALHTTVIGPEGRPLEIQIRTHQMHETAEYGIAAHWMYKEDAPGDGAGGPHGSVRDRIQGLEQLLDWQQDLKDP